MSVDPTKTLMIRRSAAREIDRRFKKLKKLVRLSITNGFFRTTNDLVHQGLSTNSFVHDTFSVNEQLDTNGFEFLRDVEKLTAFNEWFEEQVFLEVLEGSTYTEDHWLTRHIGQGYDRGAVKARRAAEKNFPQLAQVGDYSPLLNPRHEERAELIFTRSFDNLKGVTSTMADQVRNELAKGMIEGQSPLVVAKRMEDRIDKIGVTRSKLIARTEIIESHNSATIQEAEILEIELDEPVNMEWVATLDSRVRDTHRDRHEKVYTKNRAQQLIGEPNCRCSLVISFDPVSAPAVNPKKKVKKKTSGVVKSYKAEDTADSDSRFKLNNEFIQGGTIEGSQKSKEIMAAISDDFAQLKVKRNKAGKIVGAISYREIEDYGPDGKVFEIGHLGSLEKGTGSQLLAEALRDAMSKGASEIQLQAIPGSHEFFSKLGLTQMSGDIGSDDLVTFWAGGEKQIQGIIDQIKSPKPKKTKKVSTFKALDWKDREQELYEKHGVDVAGYETLEFFEEEVKMSPVELKELLVEGIADPTKSELAIMSQKNAFEKGLSFTTNTVDFGASRVLDFKGKIAHHESFEILEEGKQGSGIGKKFLKNSLELYEQVGIEKIRLNANIDVGGYAWARYGFVPTQNSWDDLKVWVSDALDDLEGRKIYSSEVIQAARQLAQSDDPKTIRAIAGLTEQGFPVPKGPKQKIGQALLLGSSWFGQLDLTNKEDYDIFSEYINQ